MRWVLILFGLIYSFHADGRFLHEDAREIDPEERLGMETFNDEVGYRYPWQWSGVWRQAPLGYRVTAGSLNADRFLFREEMKFQATDPDHHFVLALHRQVWQDRVEQRRESTISLMGPIGPDFRAILLADGDTYKKWGDLGMGFLLEKPDFWSIRIAGWSVDHFYNTKEENGVDRYTRRPYTFELEAGGRLGVWDFNLSIERDTPMTWRKNSIGNIYDNDRSVGELVFSGWWGQSFSLVGNVAYERKRESLSQIEGAKREALDRIDLRSGLALTFHQDGTGPQLGVEYIRRRAQRDLDLERQLTERSELQFSTSWRQGFGKKHSLLIGFFGNRVKIRGSDAGLSLEVKAQLAWEWRLNPGSAFLFNTTWDLDQLSRDFPYSKHEFNPWGGGAVAFMITL